MTSVETFEVDNATLAQIRAFQEQAAKETGQWTEKREVSGSLEIMVAALHEGRRRVAEWRANHPEVSENGTASDETANPY